MYTFFDLSGTAAARLMAGAGAVLIALILASGSLAASPMPLSPDTALFTIGALS